MKNDAGQPEQVTSLSLLDKARRHDSAAWRRLVELYRPLVFFWCGRAGCRGADVEDVTQEVFAAAAKGLDRFHRDRPGDTFRGWLRGITHNQALLFHRRNKHQAHGEGGWEGWDRLKEVPDPQDPLDEQEQTHVSDLYRRVLEHLRGDFEERTWQAFCRTVLDGRSPASLADELGMNPAAIRQAKARVLRRLKQDIGDLLD